MTLTREWRGFKTAIWQIPGVRSLYKKIRAIGTSKVKEQREK